MTTKNRPAPPPPPPSPFKKAGQVAVRVNREEQVAPAIFSTIEDVEHLREVGAEWIDKQGQRGAD